MKKFTSIALVFLLTASCASWKSSDFSKRKFLHLHSKEQCAEKAENVEQVESSVRDESENTFQNFAEEQTPEAPVENFVASTDDQQDQIIFIEFVPTYTKSDLDDSLNLSSEDHLVYAIKDQVKIMDPYFKWSKVTLIFSLILAVALVILFFTIDVFSPLGELLYVLLIFEGLFGVIGFTSAIRSRIAAKKLKGLSKDESQLDRADKVRGVTKWLLFFFLLVPIAGLIGLVIVNNT